MKKTLITLSVVIGVTITSFTSTLTLLRPALAVTAVRRDGILVIGVGKNVRRNITITVPRGTPFYFECKELGSSYNYMQISGAANIMLSASRGSRTGIHIFSKKGKYSFKITNINKSYNDSITVTVK